MRGRSGNRRTHAETGDRRSRLAAGRPGSTGSLPSRGRGLDGLGGAPGLLAAGLSAALLLSPVSLVAQQGGGGESPVRLGGLLRTGFRVGPGDQGRDDGFEIYDARLRASGKVGIVFDYFVQGEFDDETDELRLLDARLSVPIIPQLAVGIGQFKAPFGAEALADKGDITFVERSQITQIVAPGRQVGVQLSGEALDGRLSYRGGVFNGNGRELDNDNDDFLYAAHASYNTLGTARFYDELMVEVGASVAFSSDSAASLAGLADLPAADFTARSPRVDLESFRGDRFLWGVDLESGFRSFFLRGEYLRGELEPEGAFPSGDDEVAQGGYLEGGYNFLGAIEGVVRWDAMSDFLATVEGRRLNENPGEGTDFLVFGLNLFPGRETKLGLQYSVGVGGARRGPGLADDEFSLTAQVDF